MMKVLKDIPDNVTVVRWVTLGTDDFGDGVKNHELLKAHDFFLRPQSHPSPKSPKVIYSKIINYINFHQLII